MLHMLISRSRNVSLASFLVLLFIFGLLFSSFSASNNVNANNLDESPASATNITGDVCFERISPLRHSLTKLPNGTTCAIFKSGVIESGISDALYLSTSSDNGVTWTAPKRLTTQQYCCLGYAIASDKNNNVYAAWVAVDERLSPSKVYFTQFNGASWSSPVSVCQAAEPTLYFNWLDMCVDSNNNVHLVWDTQRPGNSTHDFMRNQIYYAKYDGAAWGSPVLISAHPDTTPFFQLNPCIAVDSMNNVHVVWEASNYPSTQGQVWYVKNDGEWHSPLKLTESTIPDMYGVYLQAPVVAVDSNDVLHIVWEAAADWNVRTDQIWYMNYSTSPSIPIVISHVPLSDTSDQIWPAITIDSANRVHVLWMSNRESVLYYSRYAPSQSWSTPAQVEEAKAVFPNFAESPIGYRETAELGYVFFQGSALMFNTGSVNSLPTGPAFSVTVSPISEKVGVGQTLRLTCSVKAGALPYSYQWRLNGTDVQGANDAFWVFNATSTVGTYLISVAVTDASNNVVFSQAAKVKVTNDYVKGYFGCIELGSQGSGEKQYSAFGSKYTLNVGANITSMSAFLTTWQGSQYPSKYSCRFAIYSDNSGSVGNLISQTKIVTYNATGVTRLCTASFDSPVTLSPGTYWLMGVMDVSVGGMASSMQTNDYNQSVEFNIGGMAFPSAGAGQPRYGCLFCIYASWEFNRPVNLQEVFSISSNSTVSSLAYDAERNQLSFTVTGPSGTVGYADLYISKSLLASPNLLTVLLDGSPLNFTSTSIDDIWILHFIYSHSTHEVTVNIANDSQNTPSVIAEFIDIKILGLIVVVLTAASLGLVMLYRKGKSEG